MSPGADLDLPPYPPERLLSAPFPERVRLVCRTWASQVDPNPPVVLALYWAKYLLLFVGGWAWRALQPRPTGEHARALLRGPAAASS
jgi:hypothetical protein